MILGLIILFCLLLIAINASIAAVLA